MAAVSHRFDDGFLSRRSISDAISELAVRAQFGLDDTAKVQLGSLHLPHGESVWLSVVAFDGAGDRVYAALPASTKFRATVADAVRQEFHTLRLEGATVNGAGEVTLTDGRKLTAVEIIPAIRSVRHSELDFTIIHSLIAFNGVEETCYRSLTDGLPPEFRDRTWPENLRCIDFSRLSELRIPRLKEIVGYIEVHCPRVKPPTEQKVADTLRTFGLRVPKAKPRRTPKQ